MDTKVKFTYWLESDGKYLGYLNDFPDHWTQGTDFSDLKENLLDLYHIFSTEKIVGIKKVEDLLIV
ncbi:MAG: type II toxin-antitoxin system HicB family antitoxin [Saprospiraceae bacterium]